MNRCGIVPFTIDHNKILMMFMTPSDPKYGGDKPQIAKGQIDNTDVDPLDEAIREGEEELGLKSSNFVSKPVYFKKYKWGKGLLSMYIVEINDMNDFNEPHYETGNVSWLTKKEYDQQGRKEQNHIINDIYNFIKTTYGITR
jgi:hypothetical protein